jgi:MFS transporter, PPP family, 3-phenylpropionic acid transporter
VPSRTPGLPTLRALYALHYAGAGLTVPYLAPFLEAAGLPGATQGFLFALRNIVYLLTQPMLGMLADRVGIARVLRSIAIVAAATSVLLLLAQGTVTFALLFVLMAVGTSALASMVDAAVIATLERPGAEAAGGPRSFSRSRIFGSVGFAAAALTFGFVVPKDAGNAARLAMAAVAVLQIATALIALAAPIERGSVRPPSFRDVGAILKNRGVAMILLAGALHWVTLTPYHTFFGAHVKHHGGGPMVVGLSIAVSVAVELVVMFTAPRWLGILAPRRVLALSTFAGVVRWTLTGLGSPGVIIAAQALHGVSYGAFYLSMIDAIVRRTPPEHRATAQALIASLAMGGGTFVGNLLAGPLYDIDQGRTLFVAAGGFSVVSAAVALAIPPAPVIARGEEQ